MASIQVLVLSPSGFLSIVGLLHRSDPVIPTPMEDWKQANIDLLIPTYNEEANVLLCLSSILNQTVIPTRIIIVDDASKDRTVEFAERFSQLIDHHISVLVHEKNEGKTPSLHHMINESTADVVCVVDGDTILRSNHYIERLVQELYQGVGIACACGIILPLTEQDRKAAIARDKLDEVIQQFPIEIPLTPDKTRWDHFLRGITNIYREELYLFLQRLIYRGEMVFFGTLVFPVGCAVAYRRLYLKAVFDEYSQTLGNDLTASEDIFIGFAFANYGYRNIVIQDVYALSLEPRLNRLLHQIFKWSSAFLQCCYYFDPLVRTPFKWPVKLLNDRRKRLDKNNNKGIEKRKILEAYRQSFGTELTKKQGRPIGWFIFTSAFEKISFPTILIIFIILGLWKVLAITVLAEVTLYSLVIMTMHKNKRFRNFLKSFFINSFLRYVQLTFDVYVIANFAKDLWITKNRNWRK